MLPGSVIVDGDGYLDARCADGDHWFSWEDLYDDIDDRGIPLENQTDARCERCGITLGQSIEELLSSIRGMIEDCNSTAAICRPSILK